MIRRAAIAFLLVVGLITALTALQRAFDASDHEKAVELVRTFRRAPGSPSVPELIQARHPWIEPKDLRWSSEVLQACFGIVRVTATVPEKSGHPESSYAFDVRLTDPSIHPTDPVTVEVVRALVSTSTTSPAAPRSN